MIQNDKNCNKTVRGVFIIDTQGKVRAILFYPQSTGRYIPEIERLLIALQTTDAFEVSTPVNWMPGDDVIVPLSKIPQENTEQYLEKNEITKHTPYLFSKKLSKEKIVEKIFKK